VLVSYRQERPAEPYSALTLDGSALCGILDAAITFGAEAIWLDAWCYRNGPEGYDHDDFCSTLHSVLAGVAGVVWLPQTNVGSRGDYPYRLWCTFEAASVRWRGTRVHIAGAGLSVFQRRVRALGSFVAAVHADGTLDRLARLNLAAYFWFFAQALFTIVGGALGFLDAVAFSEHLSAVLFIGVLWFAGRASLAREVRLAINARTVLRNMSAAVACRPCQPAAPDRGSGELGGGVNAAALARLVQELPWLPAYDRRDVLIAIELLARLPGAQPSAHMVHALALSAHTAARLSPSAGDRSASSLSLRQWLLERDIDLDGWVTGERRLSAARRPSSLSRRSGSAASAALPADPSSTGLSEALALSEMLAVGWTTGLGVQCALLTPLGAYEVALPSRGCWALQPLSRLRRPAVDVGVAWFMLLNGIEDCGEATLFALLHGGMVGKRVFNGTLAALYWVQVPFAALVVWELLRADLASWRARRVPLPFTVFHTAGANAAAAAACVVAILITSVVLQAAVADLSATDTRADARTGMGENSGAVEDIVLNSALVAVFVPLLVAFIYELALMLVLLGTASARGGWAPGQTLRYPDEPDSQASA
jgi:hypothetical protein